MVFYLPHGAEAYQGAFPVTHRAGKRLGSHSVMESERGTVISPDELSPEIIQPQNFIDLQEARDLKRFWLIDLVTGADALVQIIDHRNLSGINPLAGKTPIGYRPRFPDMGRIYVRESVGLPQRVVSTVGPERFHGEVRENMSEITAHVALCAAYAGMEVMAMGWNRSRDPHGKVLAQFISNVIERIDAV
ncbi:MAG: hypothetical protein V3U24_10290 [Candidatus Neomarinimicrobiota bacterium]